MQGKTLHSSLFTEHNVELSGTRLFVCSDQADNIKVLPVYSHEQCADRALLELTESIEALWVFFFLLDCMCKIALEE